MHLNYRVWTKVLTKFSLWAWPLNYKMYRDPLLAILCLKYESCNLKTTEVSCQNQRNDKFRLWPSPLTFKQQNIQLCSPNHPAAMYEIWKLHVEIYFSYRVRTKVLTMFSCVLDLWPFDPKMHRYLSLTIRDLRMEYGCCTLKTIQVTMSKSECWQSSVVTLTFNLLTPKCTSIFPSPSCIYE